MSSEGILSIPNVIHNLVFLAARKFQILNDIRYLLVPVENWNFWLRQSPGIEKSRRGSYWQYYPRRDLFNRGSFHASQNFSNFNWNQYIPERRI